MNDNRTIVKCTYLDALSAYQENVIYACTDTKQFYQYSDRFTLTKLDIISVLTELERLYSTNTINGKLYYVWETNELWLYNGSWILQIGTPSKQSSAFQYTPDNGFNNIYTQVLDNNGLLGDGSVVIRDYNRIIKGKMYIDPNNNDLVISSFLGGGVRFLPSSSNNNYFYFGDDSIEYTGSFSLKDNDYYTEKLGIRYKAWTEEDFTFDNIKSKLGLNVDSIVSDLEGYYINESGKIVIKYYNSNGKLCYKDEKDNQYTYNDFEQKYYDKDGNVVDVENLSKVEFDISVKYFQGHTPDYFAKATHNHQYTDILVNNLNIKEYLEDYTNDYISDLINHSDHKGIEISEKDSKYLFNIIDKNIKITGGATGIGTLSYNNLDELLIDIKVDPTKHKHSLVESQIEGASTLFRNNDFNNFYKYLFGKDYPEEYPEENLIVTSAGSNKLLLLNSEGKLPADITGQSNSTISLSKDINVIIKDSNNNNAMSFVISKDLSDINSVINIDPLTHDHSQYVTTEYIGKSSLIDLESITNEGDRRKIGITPLDRNGKIPMKYLPDQVLGNLQYQSTFDPQYGYPIVEDPNSSTGYSDLDGNEFKLLKGQYWVASVTNPNADNNNTINGQQYLTGDWLIYNGSKWDYLDNSGCVESINGKSGVVELTLDDLQGISLDKIFDPTNPIDKSLPTVTVEGSNYYLNYNIKGNVIGNLDGNALSADSSKQSEKLNHTINLQFVEELLGSYGNIVGSIDLNTESNITNSCLLTVSYIDGGDIDSV